MEQEPNETGAVSDVATVFLTNRECPWRCLMCDLWRNTLTETAPTGAIPAQLDFALAQLPPARQIKLYNSGSFFDPQAVPEIDYGPIAERLQQFEQVTVESHPSLLGQRALRFRDSLPGTLEVAMGLETAHPDVLEKLNKRMTLDQFARAADFLTGNRMTLRAFVLVKPPFMNEAEGLQWAQLSVQFALNCGASVVSLIPTRFGNGALEALAEQGDFAPPKLATLERAFAAGLEQAQTRGCRVFADLWDLEKFSQCADCFSARKARLVQMNLLQKVLPPVRCSRCDR